MNVRPDQLADVLNRQLHPVYMISGDEPLQVMESSDRVRAACRQAIEQGKPGSRFILSSGCEVPRDTPVENLRAMVEAAREFGAYD